MLIYVICHLDGDDAPTTPRIYGWPTKSEDKALQDMAELAKIHEGHVDEDGEPVESEPGALACYKCLQYFCMYPVEI